MIKLAITNLRKYNEGELDFTWITLPMSLDKLSILLDSFGDDEYFVSDYETVLEYAVPEYENLFELNSLVSRIDHIKGEELRCFNAILLGSGCSFEKCTEIFFEEDFIYYDIDSLEELAKAMVEDGAFGKIPKMLQNYIDYAAIAKDLSFDFVETKYGLISIY